MSLRFGPVERKLRAEMTGGRSISRDEARSRFGTVGITYFDRYLRRGVARIENGRAFIVEHQRDPDSAAARAAREDLERRRALARRSDEERQAVALALAKRDAQRREQLARLDAARSPEERQRVIDESRVVAIADRALASLPASAPDGPALSLFGLDLEA